MTSTTMEPLNLSEDQLTVLENSFKNLGKHPDGSTLMLIAAECGLTVEETQVSPLMDFVFPASNSNEMNPFMLCFEAFARFFLVLKK